MHAPVFVDFEHMPPSAAAEVSARRRAQYLEAGYPAVQEWHVRLHPIGLAGSQLFRIQPTTWARTPAGVVRAHADAGDALGAMHLAFKRLDLELEAGERAARARAAG